MLRWDNFLTENSNLLEGCEKSLSFQSVLYKRNQKIFDCIARSNGVLWSFYFGYQSMLLSSYALSLFRSYKYFAFYCPCCSHLLACESRSDKAGQKLYREVGRSWLGTLKTQTPRLILWVLGVHGFRFCMHLTWHCILFINHTYLKVWGAWVGGNK